MRHGKKFNHLGRTASHRKAMLSNMASSLILHKRISTTVAKAKELRKYVEPLITKAKLDTTHSRRTVFSYLGDKDSIKILFDEIAGKVNNRPGGYTRIIKTGSRQGDNADICFIELVDYNEALLKEAAPEKTKTRRSRRGGKSNADVEAKSEPVKSSEPADKGTEAEKEDDNKVEAKTEEDKKVEAPANAEDTGDTAPEAPAEDNETKDDAEEGKTKE